MAQKKTHQKYETEVGRIRACKGVDIYIYTGIMRSFFISFEHVMMWIGKVFLVCTTLLTVLLIVYMTQMIQFASHAPVFLVSYFQFYGDTSALPAWFDPLPVLRNIWTSAKTLLGIWASIGFILFMSSAILLGTEHFTLGWKSIWTSSEQQKTFRRLLYALVLLVVIKASWFLSAWLSDLVTMLEMQALQSL